MNVLSYTVMCIRHYQFPFLVQKKSNVNCTEDTKKRKVLSRKKELNTTREGFSV